MLWAFTAQDCVLSFQALSDAAFTQRPESHSLNWTSCFFPLLFFPSHVWETVTAARPKSRIADVTFAGGGAEGMQLVSWILEDAAVWLLHTCTAAFFCVLLHTETHKNANDCSRAKHISEEMLNLSLSRWNEKLCVQSQSNFSFHMMSSGTNSLCWRIEVRVCHKGSHCLWSLLGEQGRKRTGWSHALGQQDKVLEVELCVPLLPCVSCKTSALALLFGKDKREIKRRTQEGKCHTALTIRDVTEHHYS